MSDAFNKAMGFGKRSMQKWRAMVETASGRRVVLTTEASSQSEAASKLKTLATQKYGASATVGTPQAFTDKDPSW